MITVIEPEVVVKPWKYRFRRLDFFALRKSKIMHPEP